MVEPIARAWGVEWTQNLASSQQSFLAATSSVSHFVARIWRKSLWLSGRMEKRWWHCYSSYAKYSEISNHLWHVQAGTIYDQNHNDNHRNSMASQSLLLELEEGDKIQVHVDVLVLLFSTFSFASGVCVHLHRTARQECQPSDSVLRLHAEAKSSTFSSSARSANWSMIHVDGRQNVFLDSNSKKNSDNICSKHIFVTTERRSE